MVAQVLKIGPFAAFYVGDYGSSDVLTRIVAINTGPINITESLPEQFLPGLQKTIQTGLHEVQGTLNFYGDDDNIIRLSRGIKLTDPVDGAPEFNTYSLLLLYPDESANSSYFFPQVRFVHNTALNFEKTRATEINLNFLWQDRNRYNNIFYKGNYDDLAAIMGSNSPI